jgi:hypothetical protein
MMMGRLILPASIVGVLLVAGFAIWQGTSVLRAATRMTTELRSASSFSNIAGQRERSVALFNEAAKVLQHPRCMNCHPATERPTQTDFMRPHRPWVVRGADGHGAAGLQCSTCHHRANFDHASVPGHPEWHLAPASMAWQGKTLRQICAQIKDRARNGNRSLAALLHHVSEDTLVGWAWSPGVGRTPAPGSQMEFGELMKAWIESGAHCPTT